MRYLVLGVLLAATFVASAAGDSKADSPAFTVGDAEAAFDAGGVSGSNGRIACSDPGAGGVVVTPTGNDRRLIADAFAPAWSPEGRRLAVARRLPGACAPCSFAIEVLAFPGGA